MQLDSVLATRRSLVGDCGESVTTSGFKLETNEDKEMTVMQKEMNISRRTELLRSELMPSIQRPRSKSRRSEV